MISNPKFVVVPVVLAVAVIFAVFNSSAISNESELLPLADLSSDAALSREKNRVLLIEFSSGDCEYCHLLEDEFLRPMLKNSEYHEKVIIREAELYEGKKMVGFDGEEITVDQFASRYDVKVTPTMIFLDSQGKQLSSPLVGIWSIDFFGGHIDARIDEARAKLLKINEKTDN